MEALYHETTMECARLITQRYSTSFSLGIRTLDSKYRPAVYAIYGFVRFADEIVDTFHGHNKGELLDRFRDETWKAIEEGISFNPVLHAFQRVVNQYHIERELIDAFLHSMEMDLHETSYAQSGYEEYIYGSAEVVGLMCLRVFCEGDEAQYQSLKEPGRRLGAAFQKVNFLRDMKSDFKDRGRVYFPGADFHQFDQATKRHIEADIQADFDAAYQGIIRLPRGARMGVYLAYVYYLTLFKKIRHSSPQRVLSERIRVPDGYKFWLLVLTWFRGKLNYL